MKTTYIQTPVTPKVFIRRKAAAKYTNDITKLSTWLIIQHLYKRHQTLVWEVATAVTWTWLIVVNVT